MAGEIAGNAWSEVGATAIDTQATVRLGIGRTER